jgi:signal transduction histidine kinase
VIASLGFLPAVVLHFALQDYESKRRSAYWLILAGYVLSSVSAAGQFLHAFTDSNPAIFFQTLTFGYLALVALMFLFYFREAIEKSAVIGVSLVIFAISSLHLSQPQTEAQSLFVEIVGHQSSLPLVLAVLFQNYHFAFADIFLKRALSLLLLALTAFSVYILVVLPLQSFHQNHGPGDVQSTAVLLSFWILTALCYPKLHEGVVWLVDKVLLHRFDFQKLHDELVQTIEEAEDSETVLNSVAMKLATSLTANELSWSETKPQKRGAEILFQPDAVEILVPTSENPAYKISLAKFVGGRRLLSDEIKMLENIALLTARRIDVLRVTHERCELEIREKEFSKLATEAQLSALRAQINPHFLFNALTTIGYLIKASPDKALQTLMRLTQLLRSVLRSTGEFSTLEEELKLIESYLDIEKARFEDRLQTKIEIPRELLKVRVPSLILQPLVENAIKHGVSKSKNGGEVTLKAALETVKTDVFLRLIVSDTGSGLEINQLKKGVGLNNIEQRLRSYYGNSGKLQIESQSRKGTQAEIKFPVSAQSLQMAETRAK